MTEQEEAVGRQRLAVLTQHQKRLIELETDKDVLYPLSHPRHQSAVKDYDNHAAITARLEADPSILLIRMLDAERLVTTVTEQLTAAQTALATHQAVVDKATTDVTEARTALDALKTP